MSWITHTLSRQIAQSFTRKAAINPEGLMGTSTPSVLAMLNVYMKLRGASEHQRQDFIPYEHLRIHNKRFPWGAGERSLFHNPQVNPLPDYED